MNRTALLVLVVIGTALIPTSALLKFPGAVTARQLLRSAVVCRDPISGLGGDQARRYPFIHNDQLRGLPVEHIPVS